MWIICGLYVVYIHIIFNHPLLPQLRVLCLSFFSHSTGGLLSGNASSFDFKSFSEDCLGHKINEINDQQTRNQHQTQTSMSLTSSS